MELKQVIVVREDLKLSSGKTAAQVAHASMCSAMQTPPETIEEWEKQGQKKVVLKVKDLDELIAIRNKCKESGLISALIKDSGLTEIGAGTITAVGIGPDKGEKIDKVTGSLPLL